MAYTETTTTSYGTRVKNSFGGIGAGIVMFLAATCLLWWNEGRAVKTAKMLDEAQGNYVEMTDINNPDPELEGKLIHATGKAETTDTLYEDIFGVKDLAISLARKVEYYQWTEHSETKTKDKMGGSEEKTTTYTYKRKWTNSPVESGEFKDPQYQRSNFTLAQIENETKYATAVTFGEYELSESQIQSLPARTPVAISMTDDQLRSLDETYCKSYRSITGSYPRTTEVEAAAPVNNQVAENDTTGAETAAPAPVNSYKSRIVHINKNVIYIGVNPNNPEVGDVRITFTKAVPGAVSLIAKVSGNTFASYVAKNGKTLSVITTGTQTAEEMFQTQRDNNDTWTWILRIVGIMLAIGGLRSIFGILETLLKVVPFLANILGFGVNLICSIVGFVWSLLVIALAWLFYRPVLAIAIIVVAALVIFAFSSKGKALIKSQIGDRMKNKPAAEPAAEPQEPQAPQA